MKTLVDDDGVAFQDAPNGKGASLASLIVPMAVVGTILTAFVFVSMELEVAHRGNPSTIPPFYGKLRPAFTWWGLWAIAAAFAAAAIAFLLSGRERVRSAVVPVVGIAVLLSFGTSLAFLKANPGDFVAPLVRTKAYADYQADVHKIPRMGFRNYVKAYPDLMRARDFASVHSYTHPPGSGLALRALQVAFPNNLIPRAFILALLSSLILIPAWLIGRTAGGDRAALFTVLLLAVAPGPGVFVFLSMDAVFATLLVGAGALLFYAIAKDVHPAFAVAGGMLLGFASIMTFAVLFIVAFATIYAFVARPAAVAIRKLAFAAAGGLVALAVLWLLLGFDFLAAFSAGREVAPRLTRSLRYWFLGNPAVWLIFAGLPAAALGLRELISRRPPWLIALFIPLVVALSTALFLAETERVGQFATPFLVAAAAVFLARWEARSGRRRPWVVASLVFFTAAQAITLQAYFWTVW